MAGPNPEEQVSRPAACQRWQSLTFLHWRATTPLPPESHPPLIDFLTGRWRSFTRIARQLAVAPIEHPPWPLYDADVSELDEDLIASAGLPPPETAPLTHFSPGVDVRLGFPRLDGGVTR